MFNAFSGKINRLHLHQGCPQQFWSTIFGIALQSFQEYFACQLVLSCSKWKKNYIEKMLFSLMRGNFSVQLILDSKKFKSGTQILTFYAFIKKRLLNIVKFTVKHISSFDVIFFFSYPDTVYHFKYMIRFRNLQFQNTNYTYRYCSYNHEIKREKKKWMRAALKNQTP